MPQRDYLSHTEDSFIQSQKVVLFLCSNAPENVEWIHLHLFEIMSHLFRIFHPNSKGDTRHFRQILISLIRRFPEACDYLMDQQSRDIQKPFIFEFIRYFFTYKR